MKKKPYEGDRLEKVVVEETTASSKINMVKVQSLLDARIIYVGEVSGRQYEWAIAGAIVEVHESDVPGLLAKRRGKKPCCGAPEAKVFQLA